MSANEVTTRRRVVKAIELFIKRNGLKQGNALPGERELCTVLSASRRAVREALVALDAMGVIEIRPRSGCYLKVSSLKQSILGEPFPWFGEDTSPRDLFELRKLIEEESAARAAINSSNRLLGDIEEAVRQMGNAQPFIGGVADRNFHLLVARASGNALFERILSDVWACGEKLFLWDMREQAQAEKRARLREHQEVVAALRSRNPEKARLAMRHHFHVYIGREF
jgi:DNA-binding FadR family transcriptional regulator